MQSTSENDNKWRASVEIITKLLKEQEMTPLSDYVRAGDWVVFPNLSNDYFDEIFLEENCQNKVRLRIAIDVGKYTTTIQEMREANLNHYGFPITNPTFTGSVESNPYLFYDYTLWEAIGSLNVDLDLYVLYKKPLDLLKGYDVIGEF